MREIHIGHLCVYVFVSQVHCCLYWGYRGSSPPPFRPSDPALCGSRPL